MTGDDVDGEAMQDLFGYAQAWIMSSGTSHDLGQAGQDSLALHNAVHTLQSYLTVPKRAVSSSPNQRLTPKDIMIWRRLMGVNCTDGPYFHQICPSNYQGLRRAALRNDILL